MTDLNSKIEAAKHKVTTLQQQIEELQVAKRDKTLAQTFQSSGKQSAVIRTPPAIKSRRTLKGHFGKVTALHWGGDSIHLVSASQDGNLLVWNAKTSNKVQAISIKSSYVMSVGMEQRRGNLVACGGLDNLCTVYRRDAPERAIEMASHDGFLSCCRFLSEESILTASGDSTCIRWDIPSAKPVDTFAEHTADAMSISLKPSDRNIFASCSVDQTAKIWDIRSPKRSVHTFKCHTGDINDIEFMPSDGHCFATCSEDNTACIFDLRASNEIARFGTPTVPNNTIEGMPAEGFTSLAISKSGRLIFCGHAEGSIVAYDVFADRKDPVFVLAAAHERHVSCIGMSPNGDALASGSWDSLLKIWA